ncbi:hypothetical protein [Vibrio spartinae]|uniref:pEK499-p136 HEPN domain-containing protein n=1 Tax=Vibrio spartinae TaxID=1918945 RepID=A0ABX6R478_9VIBR|nr:hypothetical protein [Vibrio spartinae]QMV16135.1 hypothetical protein Vspart_03520 [Vibrio spartinae]
MNNIDKNSFLDAKNALLLVRQLSRIDRERESNQWLDALLADEERANGYSSKVPLLNQASFLAMADATIVWLRESYFKDECAKRKLAKRTQSIFDDQTLTIEIGPKAKGIDKENSDELVRRVRNSLGHAKVEIKEHTFLFTDINPRDKDDWAKIEMSWAAVGKLCESVIWAGNDLLYPATSGA